MANERQRANRRTARAIREKRFIPGKESGQARRDIPKSQINFANAVLENPEMEAGNEKQLARMASKARWGKGPSEYQEAWSKYWYKDKK